MKYGMLSQEFEGIAAKRLRAVEAAPLASNQHEINGVQPLRSLLGSEKLARHPTTFIRLAGENEVISEESWLTWYDSREKHPTRTEWRLYFPNNSVMELARPGDLLVVAKRRGGGLLMLVVPAEGTLENQIAWLFGLDGALGESFRFEAVEGGRDRTLDFAARYILDELGIEFGEPEAERLDALLGRFGTTFPTTRVFSQFARDTLTDVSPAEDPDGTLVAWLTHEEALFRRLERRIIADRLMAGFGGRADLDVDGFLHFSLSVQNRRKSRMGLALENHLEVVLRTHGIRYGRGARTENRSKPDFLFPGAAEYHDPAFPAIYLSMLGAKSTCKDRWRQVLSEARRIERKHLITLEPGISEAQTDEMEANGLQLVVPAGIQNTYSAAQQAWLMDTGDFIAHVAGQQARGVK